MKNCCTITFIAVFALSILVSQNSAAQQYCVHNQFSQTHGSTTAISGTHAFARKGIYSSSIAIRLPKKTTAGQTVRRHDTRLTPAQETTTVANEQQHVTEKTTKTVPEKIEASRNTLPAKHLTGSQSKPTAGSSVGPAEYSAPVPASVEFPAIEQFQLYPDFQAQTATCLSGG